MSQRSWFIGVLGSVQLILLVSVGGQSAIAATESGEVGWTDTGAKPIAYVRDPQSGEFVPAPPGHVSEDPNQYKADLQCQVDDNSLAKKCLPGQMQCPPREAGEKAGTPVIWKVAPRSVSNPVWTDWSASGNGPSCLYDQKPEDILPRIAARIESDFRNLPIKPAGLTAQPSPHTLKGAETNIFADALEQQFDVTLLGQQVHIVATPVEYTYAYGDGNSLGPTPSAGGPLREEEWGQKTRTSHVYQQTGDFQISVTTTFRGTYSVNGGPNLPIPGTGQFASPPQTVSVWRSITRNYADNCIVNPQGEGCPGVPAK
ncbi:hypothetical protein [Arthrobacter sp. FW306-04-A]|uniref:hypothetical protein n=1 Tax=Arthrobacter sp. FW306-04-A TaxID=2879619 RepID=UPI0037BFBE7C|nr:hypothetical protein LFT43_04595 [Arthrobacter sp. FW306-04-A]